MSIQPDIKIRITAADVRSSMAPVCIDVVHRETGELVETVTLLRYAGHYRSGAVDAYAIKDAEGKFRVRGEFSLGLSDESPFVAYRAVAEPVSAA